VSSLLILYDDDPGRAGILLIRPLLLLLEVGKLFVMVELSPLILLPLLFPSTLNVSSIFFLFRSLVFISVFFFFVFFVTRNDDDDVDVLDKSLFLEESPPSLLDLLPIIVSFFVPPPPPPVKSSGDDR
jgi:hypothetical protein